MGDLSNHDRLLERIARAATRTGARLAVAESCTGGLLAAALTSLPGSSAYFVGGAVTYANEEKTRALGVLPELLARHGAVSGEVARAMAEGIRARAGATRAVAITGIAGPGGGTPEKPVGTVWMALASPRGVEARVHRFEGDRAAVRRASVDAALEWLARELEAE